MLSHIPLRAPRLWGNPNFVGVRTAPLYQLEQSLAENPKC